MKIVSAEEIIEQVKEFCYLGNMISVDATEKSREEYIATTASIWFEIWGSWIRVKKFRFLQANFRKISIFQAILQKNIEFCRQISENFDFFQAIKKIRFSKQKIVHLHLPLSKLFYFSSKVTTFEHTSCT